MRFLYKVSVYIDNRGYYSMTLNPLNNIKNPPSQKNIVFRGSEEGFRKWLKQVKATDSIKGNPSIKATTYQGIIDSIKNGQTSFFYVWSNKAPTNYVINENFLDSEKEAKQYIEEVIRI